MRMRNVLMLVLTAALALGSMSGCSELVPPGYYGMVMAPEGLTGTLLNQGRHTCFGRDRMVLVESKEETVTESMNILCLDDLNLKFDLKVRARYLSTSGVGFKETMSRQGSKIKWSGGVGVLPLAAMYETYVSPVCRTVARDIVSAYETTQARDNREEIERDIFEKIKQDLKGTPVEVTFAAMSNIDYPEMITRAMEAKKEREVGIQQEEAQQAIELLKMENRYKLAVTRKKTRAAEAEAEGVYMQVLAKYANPAYLRLRALENQLVLFDKADNVQWGLITDGNQSVTPLINMK